MHFIIIGGGPAGNQAATHAARLGVEVTLIERDVVGGAANLWDCIPSKAMIATGGAMSYLRRLDGMAVISEGGTVDLELLRTRITCITETLEQTNQKILHSQQVEVVRGTARLDGPHRVVADTAEGERSFEADAILVSTGSRPRIPDWADLDGERILTTRSFQMDGFTGKPQPIFSLGQPIDLAVRFAARKLPAKRRPRVQLELVDHAVSPAWGGH